MENGHTNGISKPGSEDITAVTGDPLATYAADMASEFQALAESALEVSRSVRGASRIDRKSFARLLAKASRAAGDGMHDHARALIEFAGGE